MRSGKIGTDRGSGADDCFELVSGSLRAAEHTQGTEEICCRNGGLALLLSLANGLCGSSCGNVSAQWIASFSLLGIVLLSVRVVISLLRRDVNTLWTPAVIFPLGTLLYFGLGSMSTLFSSENTRSFLLAGNYSVDAIGLMRTMLLTTTGVTVCLIFMLLAMRCSFGKSGGRDVGAALSLPATAVFFTVVGAALKYGLVLPSTFGMTNVTVPGTLKTLGSVTDLGLAVMTYMAARGRKRWLFIFWLIWPVHLGLSLLELSKKTMMFAILLPAAGAFLGHQSLRRMVPWCLFAGLIFAALQEINTAGRQVILNDTGTISQADFDQRAAIVVEALFGENVITQMDYTAKDLAQVWWLRLNYSGAQLRAMELYDDGRPGEWTRSFAATVIPRFLWPDKPLATSQGRIFNRTVSGNEEARTRVGMSGYANGYWMMGWPGAVLFSAIMGVILGMVTRINYRLVIERQLIYLPVIFIGINMAATGPMGYLEKTFVGALPIFFGYLFIIFLFQSMIRTHKFAPRGTSLYTSNT